MRRADVEKARASRNVRRGKGKMRNRRYTTRKGPLVVYSGDSGISRAFRNIPGVDLQDVESLNLLQVPAVPNPSVIWRLNLGASTVIVFVMMRKQLFAMRHVRLF